MHHHPIDHYSRLRSPIHCIDARVKVFLTLLFIALESNLGRFDLWAAMTLGLLPVFLAGISQVPVRHLIRRMLLASPFILFVAVFQPFVVPGEEVWMAPGGLTVTDAGLLAAAVLVVKFLADVLMTLVLVSTTPFEDLAWALRWWRVPRALVEVLVMTFRYTFVLIDELERMVRTARLRGVDAAPLGRRLRAYGRILGVHLLRSLDRAERIYHAMLLRGFHDGLKRTHTWRMRLIDAIAAAVVAAFVIGVFAWRMTIT